MCATGLCFASPFEIKTRETQREDGTTYREKRWLRNGAIILVENWIVRNADGAELLHAQTIVRNDRKLYSVAKMKSWSAVVSDLGNSQLAFELSDVGSIVEVLVSEPHTVGDTFSVRTVERYRRRPDGFFEPSPDMP